MKSAEPEVLKAADAGQYLHERYARILVPLLQTGGEANPSLMRSETIRLAQQDLEEEEDRRGKLLVEEAELKAQEAAEEEALRI